MQMLQKVQIQKAIDPPSISSWWNMAHSRFQQTIQEQKQELMAEVFQQDKTGSLLSLKLT